VGPRSTRRGFPAKRILQNPSTGLHQAELGIKGLYSTALNK